MISGKYFITDSDKKNLLELTKNAKRHFVGHLVKESNKDDLQKSSKTKKEQRTW